ncbi:MAG: hypothetical protein U5K30_10975 [Acidimicrobiales bacterium]|nr:hypothetical protein [Acidimicrobiales bacterium]
MAFASSPDMFDRLAPRPPLVLYDVAYGPVLRLRAAGVDLGVQQLETLCTACLRAAAA